MTDKITTTLKAIRQCRPCGLERGSNEGYDLLRVNLGKDYGDNTPITFRQIYDSNGYGDTLWCLRAVDPKWFPLLRHFAVDCAEAVKHLMTDERSFKALTVARAHADGKATDDELAAAWAAAWDAARDDARDAARAAAWAADAAADAAGDAAWAADASGDAARATQMSLLFEYCKTGKRVFK